MSGPVVKKDIQLLEGVQTSIIRKVMKRCFFMKNVQIPHGPEWSVLFGFSSLKNRRKIADRITMRKTISNNLSISPSISMMEQGRDL